MESNRPVRPNRPALSTRPAPPRLRNDGRNQTSAQNQNQLQRRQNTQNSQFREFHNPYNFVPALTRQGVRNELGDRLPSGHGSYLENRWSGRIRVTLKTITPLLIPDASQAKELQDSTHKTYPLRLLDGKPYLPPTSIKGSLRAAYEAATNSRLSIFSGHQEKLAYRMNTRLGRQMVPARIESDGRGGLQVVLYPGKSEINNDGSPKGAVYAAWLPKYHNTRSYPDNSHPQHQQEVEAWVEEVQHYRWKGGKYQEPFTYWRVVEIVQFGRQTLGTKPELARETLPHKKQGNSFHQKLGTVERIRGFVCISGRNAKNKHDERIFFYHVDPKQRPIRPIPLTHDLQKQWNNLITNYQEIHKEELSEPQPSALQIPEGEWSRHIRDRQGRMAESERTLTEGSLCYAHVERNRDNYIVKGLYPVMLSRGLFQFAPDELLQELSELRPAPNLSKLSPADRVFGWVNQQGNGSYRGQLRIHSVQCLTEPDKAIEYFTQQDEDPQDNPGLPLTILGQPKPQQSRFYVSGNAQTGEPLPDGTAKQDGYASTNQGLRGRKVYPHHKTIAQNADYWDNPMDDRTNQATNGYYQEYRRPQKEGSEQRDSQNRSIQAWVKPGTQFQFEIDVINLSDVELGALLWLLKLPDDHYHRLGGGKPLGFGSVQLAIDWEKTDLRTGQDWKTYYESLFPSEKSNPEQMEQQEEQCIKQFKNAVSEAYDREKSFEEVQFIKAFLQAARGLDKPIHYPRVRSQPDPEGENFKWFTANESGEKRSLPPLWKETGLPYWE